MSMLFTENFCEFMVRLLHLILFILWPFFPHLTLGMLRVMLCSLLFIIVRIQLNFVIADGMYCLCLVNHIYLILPNGWTLLLNLESFANRESSKSLAFSTQRWPVTESCISKLIGSQRLAIFFKQILWKETQFPWKDSEIPGHWSATVIFYIQND